MGTFLSLGQGIYESWVSEQNKKVILKENIEKRKLSWEEGTILEIFLEY